MRSPLLWVIAMLLPCVACGGAQRDDSTGTAFCESYELNFLAGCQQNCEQESQVEPGDQAGIAACEKQCGESLTDDDNFSDGCPERVKQLSGS